MRRSNSGAVLLRRVMTRLAQSGISLRRINSVAIGGIADIDGSQKRAPDASRHCQQGDRMTRRLPPPWHADRFSGGYVVRDTNGFAVAYVYGRSTEAEAIEAKQMTMDEARRVASNIAKLPDMLKRGE